MNNPVIFIDENGHFAVLATLAIGAIIGGGVELASQLIENGGDFKEVNWAAVGIQTVAATTIAGPGIAAVITAGASVATDVVKGEKDIKNIAMNAGFNAGFSLLGTGASKIVAKTKIDRLYKPLSNIVDSSDKAYPKALESVQRNLKNIFDNSGYRFFDYKGYKFGKASAEFGSKSWMKSATLSKNIKTSIYNNRNTFK